MVFNYGEILKIQEEEYEVTGIIQFRSETEPSVWEEYKLLNRITREERWLSYDDYNGEYSMSKMVLTSGRGINENFEGFHEVDRGTARVVAGRGNVDVDIGEKVAYVELEDASEDNIKSIETWCDGTELSEGYYIEKSDIVSIGRVKGINTAINRKTNNLNAVGIIILISVIGSFAIPMFNILASYSTKLMSTHIQGSADYTYRTSVTSNINPDEKADVYVTALSIDAAAKDIINAIDGNTEAVQQNNEDSDDNSIAILTKKEYCLVYQDSETEETLIQISNRLYAYTSDSDVYHSRHSTRRYYRRYYYSKGYSNDKSSYGDYTSTYSTFNDTTVADNSSDTYSTYSSSVRQASIASRSSSGGGTSSGK